MKRFLLSVLLVLTGCGRAYYRDQPIELNALHSERCMTERTAMEEFKVLHSERSITQEPLHSENKDSLPARNSIVPPPISRQDDMKCVTLIRINGKEQEVNSKEIVWRWP